MSDGSYEWTMDMVKDAVLVDVIHMRYEWLYQCERLGISADEIKRRIELLESIEEKAVNK